MNPNPSSAEAVRLWQQLQGLSQPQCEQVLMSHIGAMVQDILDWESNEAVDAGQRLYDLGMKSRNMIELKYRLESMFAEELPVTLFFHHATLGMLSGHLLTHVMKLFPPAEPTVLPAPAPTKDSVGAPLAHIESLSEQEAEAELLQRIAALDKRTRL